MELKSFEEGTKEECIAHFKEAAQKYIEIIHDLDMQVANLKILNKNWENKYRQLQKVYNGR